MVPFFWTKHFDLSIRYVGHAEKWEERKSISEGDLAHRDCLRALPSRRTRSCCRNRRTRQDSLRAELAMEGESQRSS